METNNWNQFGFRVKGYLQFVPHTVDQSVDWREAREAIRIADCDDPWLTPGMPHTTILIEAASQGFDYLTYRIEPFGVIPVRRLHAFHRYLGNLAQKIASNPIKNLGLVRLSMEIEPFGPHTFLTPQAEKVVEEISAQIKTRLV